MKFIYSIILVLIFSQCNNTANLNYSSISENCVIDSVIIDNYVDVYDIRPSVLFFLKLKLNKQDSLYMYKYIWHNSLIKEKSHFWIESNSKIYDLRNINSYDNDTSFVIDANENYYFKTKIEDLNYQLHMKSLSEIIETFDFINRPDLKIKFKSIYLSDTLTFIRSKSFKIIYKLDHSIINPCDSILMDYKISLPKNFKNL